MSTPFPLEEQAQLHNAAPQWNPWTEPNSPHWYSGMGFNEDTAYVGPAYRLLEGLGSGAAKGEAVLGGLVNLLGRVTPQVVGNKITPIGDAIQDDARERVKAMTPDPATTGMATNILHGVTSGGEEMLLGSLAGGPVGATLAVGSGEATNRYLELKEQGVDTTTAVESGAVAGIAGAAGTVLPAAYGSTLLTRLLTGAAANVGFGIVDRASDHLILKHGGYPEMAAQQSVLDTSQMLADAALGATFGAAVHLHSKADERAVEQLKPNTDAALAVNLANRDRQSAPGVAVDPEAANAHQSALETATEQLLQGRPVDVSETGVEHAQFLARPERDITPEADVMLNAFKESGLMDEEANLKELEVELAKRQPATVVTPETPQQTSTQAEIKPIEKAETLPTEEAALGDRPNMEISDENGQLVKAQDALENAKPEMDWGRAITAATNCFARRGG